MKHLRLLLIWVALVAMAGIGADLCSRANPARRYADAIAGRLRAPPALEADAALDERLSGDANEAGYRWAERRGLDQGGACRSLTAAFRAGCEAYVRDQAP